MLHMEASLAAACSANTSHVEPSALADRSTTLYRHASPRRTNGLNTASDSSGPETPRHRALEDQELLACQAVNPPPPPSATLGNWLDELSSQAADEIKTIEEAFAQSNNIPHFHLNPDVASRWNILNFREEIIADCRYLFDITFQTPLAGSNPVLTGIPNERHIEAWSAAKRGYLLLPQAMIMMSFQHAANNDPPQSLNQLEYSNTDYMSPTELREAFRALGSPDYIVRSHSRNGDTRRTERWPSIGCINRRSNKLFKFRVMFPNQAIAEQVYSNYHALRRTQSTHEAVPNPFQLRPLSDLHWDQPSRTLYNPLLPSTSHLRDTKLRLSPVPTNIRAADIAQVITDYVFDNSDVDITGTVATVTFYNSDIRDIAWHAWRANPLVVRGHVLAVSALTGALQQLPPSTAHLTCHDCGRLGHIASDCTVFQELDAQGRPLRPQAAPVPNTQYDPRRDTRPSKARTGRSRSTYSGPATTHGRSASHGKTQVVATKSSGTPSTTLASSDVRRLQERFLRMEAETKRHSEELAKVKAENAAQQAQLTEQAAQLAMHVAHHTATQQTLEEQARVQAQAAEDRQAMKTNIAQAIALLTQAASPAAPLPPPPLNTSKTSTRTSLTAAGVLLHPRPFIYTWILLSLLFTGVTAFPTHTHMLQHALPLALGAEPPILDHNSFGHTGLSSTDDSANSEYSDHRIQATSPLETISRRSQRGPHRRKPWRPTKYTYVHHNSARTGPKLMLSVDV
ncbi:unnamed protein product [Aphanomyces euteiches]